MRDPNCQLCRLHADAKNVCIYGRGPQDAEIMFVGQNPGSQENWEGSPFVGPSGQLLRDLLRDEGIDIESVYLTNSVKCVTPYGKEPVAKEVNACKTYLIDEVRRVQPKVIVALGGTALTALTGLKGILKHRGVQAEILPEFCMDEWELPIVMPTLHPAFVLREESQRETLLGDIRTALRAMRGQYNEIEVPWEWGIGSWQHLMGYNKAECAGVLSFDCETNMKVDPKDPDLKITMIGIDDGHTVQIFRGDDCSEAVHALDDAQWGGIRLTGHNSSRADREWILAKYGVHLKCDDTMLASYPLSEYGARDLERLAMQRLGVPPWKRDFIWHEAMTEEEWEQLALYCARDVRYTRLLHLEMQEQLRLLSIRVNAPIQTNYEKLLLPASRALSTLARTGVYLSAENIAEASTELAQERDRQRDVVDALAAFAGAPDLNPNSWQQLGKLLYDEMDLPVKRFTDSGGRSTDAHVLKLLREDGHGVEFIEPLLQYRKSRDLLKFVKAFGDLQSVSIDGRIYPDYSLTTAVTGRTTCFTPNLQQTPRAYTVRRCVGAPNGSVLLQADYSQMELRIASVLAGEETMKQAFRDGRDLHLMLASRITGKPESSVTNEERSRAKPVNFSYLYGADASTFMRIALDDYDLVVTLRESDRFRNFFFDMWPALEGWYTRVNNTLVRDGYITTPHGRIRRLANIRSSDRGLKTEALRQGINAPVQGFASDIALLALCVLQGSGFRTVGFVHDAILVEINDDPQEIGCASAAIKDLMENGVPSILRSEFGVDLDVPLVADVDVAYAWGECGKRAENGLRCRLAKKHAGSCDLKRVV